MKYFALLLFLSIGCTTNRSLVARATATQAYYTASYEHKCVKTGNPPKECQPCHDVINGGLWKVQTAEEIKPLGYLPDKEKKELEQHIKDLEVCP